MLTSLSTRDQATLNLIISGGEPSGQVPYIVDPELPPDQNIETVLVAKLVDQEKLAIELVESKQTNKALDIFNSIIAEYPHYASVYNNRAQIYREDNSTSINAIKDLETAIRLATPKTRFLSKMQATVLKNAYTQLAAIELETAKQTNDQAIAWEYNEKASKHLSIAGSFGDKILSALATKVNPFAKLCGGMVEQVLKSERGE